MRILRDHRFTPRILKRTNIKRNEESGYPSRFKSNVTKTMVPKKRINCFDDPNISPADDFSRVASVLRKSRSRKRADKNISNIPRMRGNIPVPALRKVPMGILKEKRVVTAPKRKRTIPPAISSLFNLTLLQNLGNRRGGLPRPPIWEPAEGLPYILKSISDFKFQAALFRNITFCFNS
jgi:hypothetical protein